MKLFDKTEKQISEAPDLYSVNGKQISCAHCGGQRFQKREILLNTPGLTFFGLDWANRTAIILMCVNCGKIEWYMHEPQKIE
ncbi:MAG: DNA-binding protein [Bacteroidetes bacterium]|nr:DNA-binding protein [Bacteroidota bacterium]MBU2585026.1 DNA-binding protein [Bacteroidota bacterium]